MAVKGKWKRREEDVVIVNIYSPHTDEKKEDMWMKLEHLVYSIKVANVLCGDFNEVRMIKDRL